MWSERLICAVCGEGLNPMMRVCPTCGQTLEPKRPTVSSALDAVARAHKGQQQQAAAPPLIIPPGRQQTQTQRIPVVPGEEIVYVTPLEKPPRLPRFTPPRMMLMAVGIGFLVFGSIIALLLWNSYRREMARQAEIQAREQALRQSLIPASATPDPTLALAPALSDDNAIAEAVRAALGAYNREAAAQRYQFQVRDGVVTIDGYALNQPEKSGAENVIRALPGVRMLCSNLVVMSEPAAPALSPVMIPVNETDARRLEDALARQLAAGQSNSTTVAPQPAPSVTPQAQPVAPSTPDPQREAERLKREQELAREREEEAALRRQTEERLKREAADYERRQEEERRAEAERRARADQNRIEAGALRSGTVAWSGMVDGTDEIIIAGASAAIRHLSGGPVREPRSSFSAPVPRAPVNVRLLSANGRGSITIVQEPSAANGYSTIVRVDDSRKGGDKRYEFTLRWSSR